VRVGGCGRRAVAGQVLAEGSAAGGAERSARIANRISVRPTAAAVPCGAGAPTQQLVICRRSVGRR